MRLRCCSPYSDTVSFYTSGTAPSPPEPPVLAEAFAKALMISWLRRPSDDEFCLQMEDQDTVSGHEQQLLLMSANALSCVYKDRVT